MSKVRMRLIISLAFVLIAAIVSGIVLGVPRGGFANAETYAPTSVFYQGTGGDVIAPEKQEGSEEDRYVTFSFRNEGSVYYRRNLALKWFEADKAEPAEPEGDAETDQETTDDHNAYVGGKAAYFTMMFAFAPAATTTRTQDSATYKVCPQCGKNDLAEDAATCGACGFSFTSVVLFDRYEIVFESAEEDITKEAKATNSIVFKAQEDGSVKVGIKNAEAHAVSKEKEKEENYDDLADLIDGFQPITAEEIKKNIRISFGEAIDPDTSAPVWGAYAVTLTVGETPYKLGNFTNIGGNYLEYRSSASSTPSTPITFKTDLAALPTAAEGTTYTRVPQRVTMMELNGQALKLNDDDRVVDDTPAVLVVNEEVHAFSLGQRYSLSTEAIDVCDDSVSVVRSYYMLRYDEGEAETTTPHVPTSDDYKTLTTSTYFLPADDASASETQYVSIRYILRDGRFSNDSDYDFVYLAWYAAASDITPEGDIDYINVVTEKAGPYYLGLKAGKDDEEAPQKGAREEAIGKYQEKVEEVAGNGKTSAGKGAYIYLPSLRGLIMSDDADYRNLRFSIYYKKENSSTSASSETSLRYNNLRFQIDLEGRYAFKVIASDASGNAMKMFVDDELVDVTSSNVWDIDEIPTFTFEVTYNGADIEEAGEQDTASRGSLYNITDFEIIDLGDSIKEYELYYFDASALTDVTYSDLVENAAMYAENAEYAEYFTEIPRYNAEITEEDEGNDHRWDPDSSLSFVPQKSGYYFVKLVHYDMHKLGVGGLPAETTRYQVIEVRNPYDYIPTKSDWLSNNVTSVVLFSISAALAVIIVILFVVKPSEKTVEEVDLEKLKGKRKSKK